MKLQLRKITKVFLGGVLFPLSWKIKNVYINRPIISLREEVIGDYIFPGIFFVKTICFNYFG
jgi:hypothetical protein